MHNLSQKVTQSYVKYGFLSTMKEFIPFSPKRNKGIEVVFDDSRYGIELNYAVNSQQDRKIYGLTSWFKQHSVAPGMEINIEVLKKDKKYRFMIGKLSREKGAQKHILTNREGKGVSRVGEVIELKSLIKELPKGKE